MTNDPSRFCVLKMVSVDNRAYKVASARVVDDFVFLKLHSVDDRNAAETLRNKPVQIERVLAVPLEDGEFFIDDVVGCTLVSTEAGVQTEIGQIKSVENFGATDVFSVDCADGRKLEFPFLAALKAQLDSDNGIFTVDGKMLKEVSVYNED